MWFTHDSAEAKAYTAVNEDHHARFSHEFIAAAASYEAAKAYEHHVREHGKPVNHEKAVALLAALTGGFVDRIAETRGMDLLEREELKGEAHRHASNATAQSDEY